MLNRDFTDFIEDLSSNSPAPGGGAVVGVNAILGASLLLMVVNLTIENKNYLEVRDEAIKTQGRTLGDKRNPNGCTSKRCRSFYRSCQGI